MNHHYLLRNRRFLLQNVHVYTKFTCRSKTLASPMFSTMDSHSPGLSHKIIVFQGKNLHFQGKNPLFLLKNPHFHIFTFSHLKNLTKVVRHFPSEQRGLRDRSEKTFNLITVQCKLIILQCKLFFNANHFPEYYVEYYVVLIKARTPATKRPSLFALEENQPFFNRKSGFLNRKSGF